MANQIGKIYLCAQCGAQIIVTKGGTGAVKCCGTEMQQKK
jgi:DNA-directed RNA polymerase subunit RPC12/RpoP